MKVVVITGASRGIGRATALAFAADGARVVLIARDEAKLAEVAAACGPGTRTFAADVTDADRLIAIAGEVRAEFGRIDAWINNAGVGAVGSFTEVPLADHRRVIDVNLGGYTNGARAALDIFLAQKSGTLINVASISAYVAQPTSVAYVTSKFAIRGFTYALRQDVALTGMKDVHVCLVHPQVVDTEVFQHMANFSGRAVDINLPKVSPERVARAIVRVVKRPRRELTVGWFGRFAVLGHRLFPGLAEWMMIQLARLYYRQAKTSHPPTDGNLFGKTE